MLRGFVTAIRTLTILPVPGRDAERMSAGLPWFPLVGCMIGISLAGIAGLVDRASGGWPGGAAAALVAGSAILTRYLHLDGVADWADGFGGGRTRERTLAIMKDPHVGAFGVVALALVLLGKWVAASRLIEAGTLIWIVPAYIVSRMAMVELAVSLPYARTEGGTAGPFVLGAEGLHRVFALLVSLVLLLATVGPAGAVLLGAGWGAGRLLGLWFLRRVGGVTGDLLGACCELVETGLLMACAIGSRHLSSLTGWSF